MAVDRSRIGRSNVQRSKAHERRVAQLLSEWSGRTYRRRRNEGRDLEVIEIESTSDVIPVGFDVFFSIEAKCGRTFSLDALLANHAGAQFTAWYHQCAFDASLLTKHRGARVWPLLFFKPEPAFDWVAFDREALTRLRTRDGRQRREPWWQHLLYPGYVERPVSLNVSHGKHKVMVELALGAVVISRWKDFAAAVDPESMIHGVRGLRQASDAVTDGGADGGAPAGARGAVADGPDGQAADGAAAVVDGRST